MSAPIKLASTLIAAQLVMAGAFGLAMPAHAHADPTRVEEDSDDWDCTTMGDRVCGPNNSNHVTAGCYNDSAQLVAVWPCHIVVNADGSSDVFTDE